MHPPSWIAPWLALLVGSSPPVEVGGSHEAPREAFPGATAFRLTADTTFGWRTGEMRAAIDLAGHGLTINTGGGNRTALTGPIIGAGSITWNGGGVPQVGPSALVGAAANAYEGTFTLDRGVLDLAKPAGSDAVCGDLVIGATGPAVVRLQAADQIADTAVVTLSGPGVAELAINGHHEAFAALVVESHAIVDLGGGPGTLTIGDSAARAWNPAATLTIRGHVPGGTTLRIGTTADGLTAPQLARIGFLDPAGLPTGLYTSRIGPDGHMAPDAIVAAIDPPFDVSPAAREARATLYEIPGRATLTGKSTPLRPGMTISFFGDSITWSNGYLDLLEAALEAGPGTASLGVKLVNRGINGGGVLEVRDGSPKAAYPRDAAQGPFAEVIAADRADVAVVFIGINDVWWRETSPENFDRGLRDIVTAARGRGTVPVLATMMIRGELPDGRNADDAKIDAYCEITRRVARETGTTLVDLRRAALARLQNTNAQLRVDGTLYSRPAGILAGDGIHPNSAGNELVADLLADGIVRALRPPGGGAQ
jgi:lysophospholipase L1-like esterase